MDLSSQRSFTHTIAYSCCTTCSPFNSSVSSDAATEITAMDPSATRRAARTGYKFKTNEYYSTDVLRRICEAKWLRVFDSDPLTQDLRNRHLSLSFGTAQNARNSDATMLKPSTTGFKFVKTCSTSEILVSTSLAPAVSRRIDQRHHGGRVGGGVATDAAAQWRARHSNELSFSVSCELCIAISCRAST